MRKSLWIPALVSFAALLAGSSGTAWASAPVDGAGTIPNATIVTVDGPIQTVDSQPLALTPTFERGITDYVWRCAAGVNSFQLTINTRAPTGLALDRRLGEKVVVTVSVAESEALVIRSRGSAEDARAEYWIRCLPHDFPKLSVYRPGDPPPGWYLTGNFTGVSGSVPYVMVLDQYGTPVWYQRALPSGLLNLTLVSRNLLAWNVFARADAYDFFDLASGSTQWFTAQGSYIDPHELQVLPNGDFLLLSSTTRAGVDARVIGGSASDSIYDCVALEVDPGGEVVWKWVGSDHIAIGESLHTRPFASTGPWDPFHCNSLAFDPASGDVLVSARDTSAVYRVDKTTGHILWKLGGNLVVGDREPKLVIVNDQFGGFDAQHDARFMQGGDISLFDDESYRTQVPARAVQYSVDSKGQTARLVWSFQSPDDGESFCTGSFRRLYGGTDNVIAWGCKPAALLTEVDRAGELMMNVTFPTGETAYRAVKVRPGELDHRLLRTTAGLPPPPA